jgi:hypothetical protein
MIILCLVIVAANIYALFPRKKPVPYVNKKITELQRQIKSSNNKKSNLRYRLSKCEYEKSQQYKNFNHSLLNILNFLHRSTECNVCLCEHNPIELIITNCCGLQVVCYDCTSRYQKCIYCRKKLYLQYL